MTPAEAGALLGVAAAFDNRKPDPDTATAWAMALDGAPFADCRDAIVAHYRRTTEWLMPAHVIDGAKEIRRERLRAYGPIEPPSDLDPDNDRAYVAWFNAAQLAVASGEEPPGAARFNELHPRRMPDMSALMRKVPATPTTTAEKDPEYRRRKEAARAELDGLRERLADDEPPTPAGAAVATTGAAVAAGEVG